jgi:hypothetical protein
MGEEKTSNITHGVRLLSLPTGIIAAKPLTGGVAKLTLSGQLPD